MRIQRLRLALTTLIALAALVLLSGAYPTRAAAPLTQLRIGYQRNGVWPLIKAKGALEKAFPNVQVTWSVFPAGPQLLEALNAGAIDVGATGDTPPIFAQAAGTPLVYIASVAGNGAGQDVLVPENSPLKTVADLKGKKVAFTQASSAHLALVRALNKFNVNYKDITPVFLVPADARAAFQSGSVDAWVVWDPFRAAAIKELNARVLLAGQDIGPTKSFVEASKDFVNNYPDATRTIVQQVQQWNDWIRTNQDEYADILAKETGLDVAVIKFSLQTAIPDYLWIDDDAVAYQQNVADIFFNLGLIPNKLTIKDVVWVGGTNPAATPAATLSATAAATAAAAP